MPQAGLASAPFAMNDVRGAQRRLVWRVVSSQALAALLVAGGFAATRGAAAAGAALAGGLIAAIGSALFGWRFFATGIAPGAVVRRALFAAESLKWFWYVVAIWAALARLALDPPALLIGLIAAQFGYWLGLVGMKRG